MIGICRLRTVAPVRSSSAGDALATFPTSSALERDQESEDSHESAHASSVTRGVHDERSFPGTWCARNTGLLPI